MSTQLKKTERHDKYAIFSVAMSVSEVDACPPSLRNSYRRKGPERKRDRNNTKSRVIEPCYTKDSARDLSRIRSKNLKHKHKNKPETVNGHHRIGVYSTNNVARRSAVRSYHLTEGPLATGHGNTTRHTKTKMHEPLPSPTHTAPTAAIAPAPLLSARSLACTW